MYRRFGARVNTREKLNLSDKGLLFVCAGYLCKADVTERSVRSADARPFPNASGNMEHVYAREWKFQLFADSRCPQADYNARGRCSIDVMSI